MGEQQPKEYIITGEQAEEYAKLYAEANTADMAPMTKVHEVANKFLISLHSRPAPQQPMLSNDADRCYICGKKFERGITVYRDEHGWRHTDTDSRCCPQAPAPAPEPNLHTCRYKEIRNDVEFCHYYEREISPGACKQRIAQAAAKEREKVQPFVDLARVLATKCDEMQDLMRRNKIVIDNVQEPMQKLAFTFYSEIAELAHKAEVVIEEYEESLREGAGKPDKGR